jgi:O-antigen biosynthesis protein
METSGTTEHKRLIVVLGMHRSGTSAITRALLAMGVQLGDKLMDHDEGNNDKGFWEDVDINALNVEMLYALNNDWHHLSLIKPESWEFLNQKGFAERAAQLLQQKTIHAQVFGFKDPRISKLLPFWKEVFSKCNFQVNYILALRHPLSVALSLARRNAIDMEKSHLLWLIHMIKSLSAIAGSNYIVVDYDHLMQDANHELTRIAAKFQLTIDSAELEKYKSTFLDHHLRHTVFTSDDLMHHDRTSDLLRDVYTTLTDLSADKKMKDDELPAKTKYWEAELIKLNLSLSMADKVSFHLNHIYEQSLEKDKQILKLTDEKENEIKKLNESLEKAGQLATQIALLNQQLLEKENTITEKISIIDDQATLVEKQEQVIALQKDLNAAKDQIILHQEEEKIDLLKSWSWRITKPLRFIAKLFRKPGSKHS